MSYVRPNAQAKNIYELFAGKVFKVPDYQRSFAWDKKNWSEFWNDIKEGLSTNTEHYWGTITLKSTNKSLYCAEKDTTFNLFEVVDGQQRITTLYLFLLALSNVGRTAVRENFVKTGSIYRVELGRLNNQFLKDLVDNKNPQPNIRTNRFLKEALEYLESNIRTFGDFDSLSKYVQNITFSLEFVVHDETLAIKTFEVLNDRGKPLTLLDKTKSFLMFYSSRYINGRLGSLINVSFGNTFLNYDLVKDAGEKESIDYIRSNAFSEDELLRFFYHYFAYYAIKKYKIPIAYYYDITANDVFEIFTKGSCNYLKNNPIKLESFIKDFLESLEKFTKAFKRLTDKLKTPNQFKKLFSFLGLNSRIYPLIISLEAENILNQQLLNSIESLDLRVYKIRGTAPRAELYRDTISQVKMNPDPQTIDDNIKQFVDGFMPNALFQNSLNQVIYGNPATKYILWEFEKFKNPSFTDYNHSLYKGNQVEHIFSATTTISFPGYGFQTEREYWGNIQRFGNLCLLEEGINKKIQNMVPQNKAIYYQQSVMPETKKLGFTIANNSFTKSEIDGRTQNILQFCLGRW